WNRYSSVCVGVGMPAIWRLPVNVRYCCGGGGNTGILSFYNWCCAPKSCRKFPLNSHAFFCAKLGLFCIFVDIVVGAKPGNCNDSAMYYRFRGISSLPCRRFGCGSPGRPYLFPILGNALFD